MVNDLINSEELYNLLPEGTFHLENVLNKVRNYSPGLRFQMPNCNLYEILNVWHKLIEERAVFASETKYGVVGWKSNHYEINSGTF